MKSTASFETYFNQFAGDWEEVLNSIRSRGRIEFVILGQELCRLRKKAGLSQRQVEAALSQSTGWTSRIENAHMFIDFATMTDFIALTGGDFLDIMSRVQKAAHEHYESLGQKPPFH